MSQEVELLSLGSPSVSPPAPPVSYSEKEPDTCSTANLYPLNSAEDFWNAFHSAVECNVTQREKIRKQVCDRATSETKTAKATRAQETQKIVDEITKHQTEIKKLQNQLNQMKGGTTVLQPNTALCDLLTSINKSDSLYRDQIKKLQAMASGPRPRKKP